MGQCTPRSTRVAPTPAAHSSAAAHPAARRPGEPAVRRTARQTRAAVRAEVVVCPDGHEGPAADAAQSAAGGRARPTASTRPTRTSCPSASSTTDSAAPRQRSGAPRRPAAPARAATRYAGGPVPVRVTSTARSVRTCGRWRTAQRCSGRSGPSGAPCRDTTAAPSTASGTASPSRAAVPGRAGRRAVRTPGAGEVTERTLGTDREEPVKTGPPRQDERVVGQDERVVRDGIEPPTLRFSVACSTS